MAFANRSFDYSSKQLIPCVVMTGVPTEKTNGAIGALYMDKESGSLYKCVSADYCDNLFTWKIVGEVSDDQIQKSVSDYLTQNPVSGGLSDAEKDMLLTLFRGAVYQDQFASETAEAYIRLTNLWGSEAGDDSHTHSYTGEVTTAANCTTAGVKTFTCQCGDAYTEEIPATGHTYVEGVCSVCGAADPAYNPDVTLTSISAVYSGGDVAVGTAVADLTGIVVTAHYSDGSSETVTGYTLSGTIAEGSNTVTVSYGGKTTTFSVTGVAESGGEIVEMIDNGDNLQVGRDGIYSDSGETTTDVMVARYGRNYISKDTFEVDTTVTIKMLFNANNTALKHWAACVTDETVGSLYYAEYIGHAKNEEYTATYTVKAGYRLAIISYNSTPFVSLVVTK